jgi:Zn-dependent protease with chaperone function
MRNVPAESWLKVILPALPVCFTLFGTWLYWGDNPLPLLAPPVAFWGVVLLYYLFSNLVIANRSYQLFLTMFASVLWAVCSITSHNLSKFLAATQHGPVLSNHDFWYSYICATIACLAGLAHFLHYEPFIADQMRRNRQLIESRSG